MMLFARNRIPTIPERNVRNILWYTSKQKLVRYRGGTLVRELRSLIASFLITRSGNVVHEAVSC